MCFKTSVDREYIKWVKKHKRKIKKECRECKKARDGRYGVLCEHCINDWQQEINKKINELKGE